jgi:hypothetical protein
MAALIGRVRAVTDTENDGHVTDSFLKGQIHTLYGQLWGTVVETGLRYFETSVSLVSDGTNVLEEPDDQFSYVGLDYVQADGRRFEVFEVMAQERTLVRQPHLSGTRARYFELVDDQYKLYPTPPTGQTYELLYIPHAPDLTAASDALLVDVVTPDGEAFLTYGVAVMVLARKDQDPRLMQAEREAAKQRLSEWAAMRAFHQPRRQIVQSDIDEYLFQGDWRLDPP